VVDNITESDIKNLAAGQHKGKIVVLNRLGGVGVDYATNLVIIADGRYQKSIWQQIQGRPSRGGEFGKLHLVVDKDFMEQNLAEIVGIDWAPVTGDLKGDIGRKIELAKDLAGKEGAEGASRTKEDIAKDILDGKVDGVNGIDIVQRYMDAWAEGNTYKQTIPQLLRDRIFAEISNMRFEKDGKTAEISQKEFEAVMEGYSKNHALMEQQYKVNENGFSGREQLKRILRYSRSL